MSSPDKEQTKQQGPQFGRPWTSERTSYRDSLWPNYFQKLSQKDYLTQIISKIINNLSLTNEEKGDLLTYIGNSKLILPSQPPQGAPGDSLGQGEAFLTSYLCERFKQRPDESPAKLIQLLESERQGFSNCLGQLKQIAEKLEGENRSLKAQLQAEKYKLVQIVGNLEKKLSGYKQKCAVLKEKQGSLQVPGPGEQPALSVNFEDIAGILQQKDEFIAQGKQRFRKQKFKLMLQVLGLVHRLRSMKKGPGEPANPRYRNNPSQVTVKNQPGSLEGSPKRKGSQLRQTSLERSENRRQRDDTLSVISLDAGSETRPKIDLAAIQGLIEELAAKRGALEAQQQPDRRHLYSSLPGSGPATERQLEQFNSAQKSLSYQGDLRTEVEDLAKRLKLLSGQLEGNLKALETKIISGYKKIKQDELLVFREEMMLFQKEERNQTTFGPSELAAQYFELLSTQEVLASNRLAGRIALDSEEVAKRPQQLVEEELRKQKFGFYAKENQLQTLKEKSIELKDVNEYLLRIIQNHENVIEELKNELEESRRLLNESQSQRLEVASRTDLLKTTQRPSQLFKRSEAHDSSKKIQSGRIEPLVNEYSLKLQQLERENKRFTGENIRLRKTNADLLAANKNLRLVFWKENFSAQLDSYWSQKIIEVYEQNACKGKSDIIDSFADPKIQTNALKNELKNLKSNLEKLSQVHSKCAEEKKLQEENLLLVQNENRKFSEQLRQSLAAFQSSKADSELKIGELENSVKFQETQVRNLTAEKERLKSSLEASGRNIQANEAHAKRFGYSEASQEFQAKFKAQEQAVRKFMGRHSKSLQELSEQVLLLEERLLNIKTAQANGSKSLGNTWRRSDAFKKELLSEWIQARLDTLQEVVFDSLAKAVSVNFKLGKAKREKFERIRQLMQKKVLRIDELEDFVENLKAQLFVEKRKEFGLSDLLALVSSLKETASRLDEMNNSLGFSITEENFAAELQRLKKSDEFCMIFRNMFNDQLTESDGIPDFIKKLFIIKQKIGFFEKLNGVSNDSMDLMDENYIERFGKNYDCCVKIGNFVSQTLNKPVDEITLEEIQAALSGAKPFDSLIDIRSQKDALEKPKDSLFSVRQAEMLEDSKSKPALEQCKAEMEKFRENAESLALENATLTDKFFRYQEEICLLKEEVEQKNKEIAELRDLRNTAGENKETGSSQGEKTKIRNLQVNVKNLEKKLESAKTIFEALGLNINEKALLEKFKEKISELKASPAPLVLEFRARPKTPKKYNLYEIDEDKYLDDNLSLSKSNTGSQNELEIKTFHQNNRSGAIQNPRNKSFSDRSKVNKKNYFITTFMNYDKKDDLFNIESKDNFGNDLNLSKESLNRDSQEENAQKFN